MVRAANVPEIKTFRMREACKAVHERILDRCSAGYRSSLQRTTYFIAAKLIRTYLKLRQHCYAESHVSQALRLFSRRRWSQLFGVWS